MVRERPECGLAWVQLARLYIANYAFEIAPVETPIDEAIDLLQNAVHLDPSSQRARTALASAFLLKGELVAGRVEAERAYELSPDSLRLPRVDRLAAGPARRLGAGPALIRRSIERNPGHIPWRCTPSGRITCGAESSKRRTRWPCASGTRRSSGER